MEFESRKTDEEPVKISKQTDEHDEHIVSADTVKKRGAFSNLKRELSDEDLNSPGTQRLILNELDKYEECSKQLELYKSKYYECDKDRAIYQERANSSNAFEILYSSSLSVGAMLIGLTPSLNEKIEGWFVGVVGLLLLAGGIIAKCFKK